MPFQVRSARPIKSFFCSFVRHLPSGRSDRRSSVSAKVSPIACINYQCRRTLPVFCSPASQNTRIAMFSLCSEKCGILHRAGHENENAEHANGYHCTCRTFCSIRVNGVCVRRCEHVLRSPTKTNNSTSMNFQSRSEQKRQQHWPTTNSCESSAESISRCRCFVRQCLIQCRCSSAFPLHH